LSWKTTPSRTRSDFPKELTLDDKIDIFYERVTGWQLDIADKVINGYKDEKGNVIAGIVGSGFAVLNILLSYFEMVAKYKAGYCGAGKAGEYFGEGFKMVFPEFEKLTWLPEKLYSNARCGLYHHGMTEGGIILKGEGLPPITPLDDEMLIVNPHTLVLRLKEHFETYIKELRNDNNFKSNFEKRFDEDST
jgi:hypothetical protein